ncbi:MAG TPA: helix-turn-helix transcriptional regulator [Acidobacteriaceae bacterium]|jgi:transcriptional regulator with XRE-family HTH domain|nr:helix-turn-helix transcriptional regulator [Acidobacteriaceae bacterium]
MANMHTALAPDLVPPPAASPINIGVTIRSFRLQKGLSQGDIEKRTGLLRCYLSRVENGHTIPSLETLQKIALALDLPLSHFFSEDPIKDASGLSLTEDEIRFLTQVQRYASNLTDSDRRLLLAMVRKFAATVSTSTFG